MRRVFELAAIGQQLDATFGRAELLVAVPGKLDAALEQRQRLLERHVAFLELLDDFFELRDGGFEIFDGLTLAHRSCLSSTLHASSPSASVTRTPCPAATACADR